MKSLLLLFFGISFLATLRLSTLTEAAPLVLISLSFLDTVFNFFSTTLTSTHPNFLYKPDRDIWTLTVIHNANHQNLITLTGVHIPTPATLLLFFTGLIALPAKTKKTRF